MKKILLSILTLIFCLSLSAQQDIANEEFTPSFTRDAKGGVIRYQGKQYSFTVDLVGKEIKTTSSPGFFMVDEEIFQASIVPLPPVKLDLGHLTEDQQKQTLAAYVDYEMNYFKNEAKLKCTDLKKEWLAINSRLFLLWHFTLHNTKNDLKQQIYLSTICFNQVLDLNMIVLNDIEYAAREDYLKKTASTIKTFTNH